MNLTDILSVEQFIHNLAVPDRWAAIDALIDRLVRLGKIAPEQREAVRKAVKDRETTKSTGIGYGLAFPHASVPGLPDVLAMVARVTPPIDFQALDEQPVSLCVLLLTPQGQFQKHLQTLSAFARFLNDKERRQRLANATSAQAMWDIFRATP